jgi:citrate lyase subunit beta/citryl-CoA lyase
MNPRFLAIETASTLLFVPASRPERFGKALASGADLVIIDLEDAVSPTEKESARQALLANWSSLPDRGRCLVRINPAQSDEHALDLALCARLDPLGIVLPKVENPGVVARLLRELPEAACLPMIESARGWQAVQSIASAPGVVRLIFGNLDFQADLGMQADSVESELIAVRLSLVAAARSAGIAAPIDGVTLATDDAPLLAAAALRARRLGFSGKLCIHPRQVDPVRTAFVPSALEIAWARGIIDASAKAEGAALQVDGQMIDRPVVLLAQAILTRAGS